MVIQITAITGPPCGGKSTRANALAPSAVIIKTGKIAAEIGGKRIKQILDLGVMYPKNEHITHQVRLRLADLHARPDDARVVIDGYPRSVDQLDELNGWCTKFNVPLTLEVVHTSAFVCATRAQLKDRIKGHDARSALWFGVQLHELVKHAETMGVHWTVIDGMESPR